MHSEAVGKHQKQKTGEELFQIISATAFFRRVQNYLRPRRRVLKPRFATPCNALTPEKVTEAMLKKNFF